MLCDDCGKNQATYHEIRKINGRTTQVHLCEQCRRKHGYDVLPLSGMGDILGSFNEFFGTGSGHFNSGEENIFLADCYHKKCRIFYCKDKIVKRLQGKSSWFTSFNDEKFIKDRGAIYYAMSKIFFPLYIFRFAFKNRKKLKKRKMLNLILI